MELTKELASRVLNITATNTALKDISLLGIFVASASGGPTIKVADANRGTIANTFTPASATWYRIPVILHGTVTVTIGGTVDCTLFYDQN